MDTHYSDIDSVYYGMRLVLKVLRGSSAIPVKGCRWVSLDSHPMVSDDKDMERLFQGKEGVYFVDVGERLGTGSNRNRGRTSTEGNVGL